MKIKELFDIGGISQSFNGTAVFLDEHNCQVNNKTLQDKSVLLHLKRSEDGEEGQVRIRVNKELESISEQLLKMIFVNEKIIGLTISQLREMETGIKLVKLNGRYMLEHNHG